jgi:FkbM family methyltransferase
MNFYSQAGQDKWVYEFFKGKTNGYFIDIGANDGVQYSNTYILEKQLNWNGLCVEADPFVYEKLIKNRNSGCLNYAVTNFIGNSKFIPNDMYGGLIDSNNFDDRQIEVKCSTFEKIFQDYNIPNLIDYMSLDIEGSEIKALEKFPFNTHDIIILTVEHNLYHGSNKMKNGIYEILSDKYQICRENVDHLGYAFEDWYINKKYISML